MTAAHFNCKYASAEQHCQLLQQNAPSLTIQILSSLYCPISTQQFPVAVHLMMLSANQTLHSWPAECRRSYHAWLPASIAYGSGACCSRPPRIKLHSSTSGQQQPQQPVEHLQHKIANTWTTNHSNIISHDPADASKVARYKRIMLKVSGEALAGSDRFGIEPAVLEGFAAEIKAARAHGIQIAVVVGGGNYFRGASAWAGLERATADYVGMLATVMNALCLQVRCSAYSGNRTCVVVIAVLPAWRQLMCHCYPALWHNTHGSSSCSTSQLVSQAIAVSRFLLGN